MRSPTSRSGMACCMSSRPSSTSVGTNASDADHDFLTSRKPPDPQPGRAGCPRVSGCARPGPTYSPTDQQASLARSINKTTEGDPSARDELSAHDLGSLTTGNTRISTLRRRAAWPDNGSQKRHTIRCAWCVRLALTAWRAIFSRPLAMVGVVADAILVSPERRQVGTDYVAGRCLRRKSGSWRARRHNPGGTDRGADRERETPDCVTRGEFGRIHKGDGSTGSPASSTGEGKRAPPRTRRREPRRSSGRASEAPPRRNLRGSSTRSRTSSSASGRLTKSSSVAVARATVAFRESRARGKRA